MQHSNPLLDNTSDHKFITIGEIMLRLTPPNYDKIRVATNFEASYGGSEANIALALANLGVDSTFFTVVPNNSLGKSAVRMLRSNDVHCTPVILTTPEQTPALANLGVDSTFFTVVPNNSLGKSAVRMLRSNDVHCTPVILTTPEQTPSHRLGTYYLEAGYGIRASKVTYDRKHSAFTEFDFSTVDIAALLDGFTWLHLSGITPALNQNCRDFIMACLKAAKEKGLTVSFDGNFRSKLWTWEEARDFCTECMACLKAAKEKGLTVSFDGNFRSKLWTWEEARDFCTECLPYVDVLLGIEPYHLWKDEDNHNKGDVKDGIPLQPSYEQQDEIFQAFVARYPNLKCIARHVRYAHSGSENSLKAFMWYEDHTFESKLFTFNILDRVGGGDAFASGLIYAMMHDYKPMDMVNFAVASSVIKHTIRGDGNITDDVSTIKNLMNMNYDIKR